VTVDRLLPTDEAADLIALVRQISTAELAPNAAAAEAAHEFPAAAFATLGAAGLLGLPFPAEYGGGEQPYEVYLQVLEELASAWFAVGLGVSVHTLSAFPLWHFGTAEQKSQWLPEMTSGGRLGAFMLSEAEAGSDVASMRATAVRDGSDYVLNGTKAWVSNAGVTDYYAAMVRTGEPGPKGISCFLLPADSAGIEVLPPERKMGLNASPTCAVNLHDVRLSAGRLIGAEGQGMAIALGALTSGRLGIAACATGLAQAALDYATEYAKQREQFGRPIFAHQGLAFLLADMAAAVGSARATYLDAARRYDAGRDVTAAAAIAKLVATDMVMKVTTDAVQVLGGAGYTMDHPVERYLREAKVTQIFEGTNQIQRLIISRTL
jgi:alkylation response protein AidB-like acyl-CoA dehydrogenase